MRNRYSNRLVLFNANELYDKVFEERHVKGIRQYGTGFYANPTVNDLQGLTKAQHIWAAGDRYYKLSTHYYNSPQYWWVIALFNQKPTDADVKPGDLIFVPIPLEKILRVYR